MNQVKGQKSYILALIICSISVQITIDSYMSKQKSQVINVNPEEVERSKKKILQLDLTVNKLQKRLERLEEQNCYLRQKIESEKNRYDQEIFNYKKCIQVKSKQQSQLIVKLNLLKFQYDSQKTNLKEEIKKSKYINQNLQSQFQVFKAKSQDQIRELKNRMADAQKYLIQKDRLIRQRNMLKQYLQIQRKQKQRDLSDKERQKVQATDKLKKDMMQKIQQTKSSLLSLNKQQFVTTSKLAVLQNLQLRNELELQSRQTEKVLKKNMQLSQKVMNLQRDSSVHKQIQMQLSRRQNFSKKMLKSISNKMRIIQDQKRTDEQLLKQSLLKQKQDLTVKLGSQLYESKKKLQQCQQRLQKATNELKSIKHKFQTSLKDLKYFNEINDQTIVLITRYLRQVLTGAFTSTEFDLQRLKNTCVKQWSQCDIKFVLQQLLQKIKNSIKSKIQSKLQKLMRLQEPQQITRKQKSRVLKGSLRRWGRSQSFTKLVRNYNVVNY